MKRALTMLVLCASGAVLPGCGDNGGGVDAGNVLKPDLITYPTSCTGSIKGFVNGSFDCGLNVQTVNAPEMDLTISTTNYVGEIPDRLQIAIASPSPLVARTYRLSELDGTILAVDTMIAEKYRAINDGGSTTPKSSLTFALFVPPTQPVGMDTWIDTTMHGNIDAVLAADANSPADPTTNIMLKITF